MHVRTRRFVQADHNVAGVNTALYTVPADHRALIKACSIYGTTAPLAAGLGIHVPGGATTLFLFQPGAAAGVLYAGNGLYYVAEAGDEIIAYTQAACHALIHVAGILFDLT